MKQNHSSSIFFSHKLITLFHFSLAGRSEHICICMSFLGKNKGIVLQTLRGEQKYQVKNVDVEKIKLSRLLVQRINELKMNEIQRKTPQ